MEGGTSGIFTKIFLGGAKSGEICFFPLETKKTTFFAENFKIQLLTPMFAGSSNLSGWGVWFAGRGFVTSCSKSHAARTEICDVHCSLIIAIVCCDLK